MARPARHTQTRVRGVEIDEGIAPLIDALWTQGFHTFGSCQEFRPGTARIWFDTEGDRRLFMAQVHDFSSMVSGDGYVVDFLTAEIPALTERISTLDMTMRV